MKKSYIAIISLLAVVLTLISCQAFAQGVALSPSYDNGGAASRMIAGFGVDGDVTWNGFGLARYLSSDKKVISKDPFEDCSGDATLNSYGVSGRWFVTANPDRRFVVEDVYTMDTGEESKTSIRKQADLTQMFADGHIEWDTEAKAFLWSGSGASAPGGKFNTMKVRVVDAEGAESFYFIGDSATGNWKRTRTYFVKELINGQGKYGPYAEGVWHINDANLDVKIVVNSLYDQARFDIQITNLGDTATKVGFAMTGSAAVWTDIQNMDWGKNENKGGQAFYYLPGVGMANRGRQLNQSQLPDKLDIYGYFYDREAGVDQYGFPRNSSDMISHAAHALKGNDTTTPDYLTIDNSYNLLGMGTYTRECIAGWWYDGEDAYHDDGGFPRANVWPEAGPGRAAYKPDTSLCFEEFQAWPTVYMVTWKTAELLAGKTRQIVTYYGQGDMDFCTGTSKGKSFYRNSFITMVESPSNLTYSADDNSITPEEFVVTAKVANVASEKTNYDIKNIAFTIDIPKKGDAGYCGLALADGEEATKKFSGTLKRLSNTEVSWTVKVVGDFSGDASFTVKTTGSYIGDPAWQHPDLDSDTWTQSVTRTVSVPGTTSGTIDQDWTLASNPFHSDSAISIDDVYGEGNTVMYYWDPLMSGDDKYISEKLVSNITPGQGYWIGKDSSMKSIDFIYPAGVLPNEIDLGDPDYVKDKHVTLYKGWNIVGNPYMYPVQWLNCNIRNKRTGDVASITEAVDTYKWMGSALYGWNQSKYGYTLQNTTKAQLLPHTGYWVYAYENLEIIYNPSSIPGSTITIGGTVYPMSIPVE